MKTVIITAHQNVNGFNNSMSLPVTLDDSANFSTVAGTALNRLFRWVSLIKKHNTKGAVKSNYPLDLKFEVIRDNEESSILFDTATLGAMHPGLSATVENYRSGMKLGNTAKAKRRFALKFMDLFTFATENVECITFEAFIARLSDNVVIDEETTDGRKYAEWLQTYANDPVNAN